MQASELIGYLTPIVVWLVTMGLQYVLPKIPGLVTLAIAGILSAVLAWIVTYVDPGNSWLIQFGAGLLAVVIQNAIQQMKNFKGDVEAIKANPVK